MPAVYSHCGAEEAYFIDAWDTRKGAGRLKSFERDHIWNSVEVAEALSRWG